MTEHGASLKPEDKKRYEGQQATIAQIVAIYDDPSYSPDSADQGVRIVTLMNEVRVASISREDAVFTVPRRCKTSARHQQSSWDPCHQDSTSERMDYPRCQVTASSRDGREILFACIFRSR